MSRLWDQECIPSTVGNGGQLGVLRILGDPRNGMFKRWFTGRYGKVSHVFLISRLGRFQGKRTHTHTHCDVVYVFYQLEINPRS